MSFFQQQPAVAPAASAIPFPSSSCGNRKRKEMMDDDGMDQTGYQMPERRKLSLPRGKLGGNEPAMFHPLDTQDNLRMLMQLGLISSNAGSAWNSASNASPKSVSSDSLHGNSSDDGYFSSGHGNYPNIAPYGVRAFTQAQQEAGMDVDPCAANHGPSCTSVPQLYVCHDMGSALYARCRDCNFSWEVPTEAGPSHTLSYSP